MTTEDLLGQPPVGALTEGEVSMLRAWAHDYAVTMVAAERERCARIVETQDTYGDQVGCWFETLAAKIRA